LHRLARPQLLNILPLPFSNSSLKFIVCHYEVKVGYWLLVVGKLSAVSHQLLGIGYGFRFQNLMPNA
jgi:hypothetical protein